MGTRDAPAHDRVVGKTGVGLPICEVWFETEPVEEGIVRIVDRMCTRCCGRTPTWSGVAIAIF